MSARLSMKSRNKCRFLKKSSGNNSKFKPVITFLVTHAKFRKNRPRNKGRVREQTNKHCSNYSHMTDALSLNFVQKLMMGK
jgi:hypothetical protein